MSPFCPGLPEQTPDTLARLRDWMLAEGANFGGYALDGRALEEGFAARHDGQDWLWGAVDRGQWREVARFATEAELAGHAYAEILGDKWAFSHLLCMTPDRDVARDIEKALEARGVVHHVDAIPYGRPDDRRWRVFVFGRDADRVKGLAPVETSWLLGGGAP